MKFRTRLRLWINYSKMTQAQLEKRTGLCRKTIGNYVAGRREPRLFALMALAQALGVTLDQLVFGLPPNLTTPPSLKGATRGPDEDVGPNPEEPRRDGAGAGR